MLLNCGAGEGSWESLGLKEIKPVHPKGNQSWIFIGKTDAKAPVLQPPDAKNWLIGKDPDAGKDWRRRRGRQRIRWHHQLNGNEFRWALGVGDGQRGLVCCSPWGCKELDMTERLNWTELNCVMSGDFLKFAGLYFPHLCKPRAPHKFVLKVKRGTYSN